MAYLDHAATTPMLPEAVEAYVAAAGHVGNASSLHAPGGRARRQVEEARERVAASLGARPSEVIFTGGGTESDNLAVKGIYWARRAADPRRNRVVASAAEHHAVLDAVEWLARPRAPRSPGCRSTRSAGSSVDALREELDRHGDEIAVITVDVGQQRGRHGPAGRRAGRGRRRARHPVPHRRDPGDRPGAGRLRRLRASPRSPPPGTSSAARRASARCCSAATSACTPLLHGGGQERDVRSGTLDVAGITAFAVAVEIAVRPSRSSPPGSAALRDELVARVRAAVPDAVLNGDPVRPAARQRPLLLPRLRGRRAAAAARRGRASPARPGRPARPASPSPRTS